ncbi:glycoside hydrolase family 5 protein [Xylariaceae sp. FL0662B]|nr:glycoside hydrolase family 5 protein [Xylariaceae sp. FL0662B]
MKFLLPAVGALALSNSVSAASNTSSQASKSFMGSNLYFIQGLADADQDAYISDLAAYGAKAVRVWVRQEAGDDDGCVKGSTLSVELPDLETTLGEYNDETLDALDKVVYKLAQKGIKVIISPHDANSLLGDYRRDVYSDRWTNTSFYSSQDAMDAYDKRIDHILQYTGAYSGKVWKDWSDAILAFDLQNEPMSPDATVCQDGDKAGWLCGRAEHMRATLGASPIKIATGGIGGDISHGCTFIEAATQCDAIDLIAVHRYAGSQASNPGQWSGAAQQWVDQSNGKLVLIEEWGVDTGTSDPQTELPAQGGDINAAGLPSLYWQFLPRKSARCADYDPSTDDGDHFGIFVEGEEVDIGAVVRQAAEADAVQDWSAVLG